MDCPAIGLPGPFDFSAPHDMWFVALLPLYILIFGGIFFSLKRFWERRFRCYPANRPAPFFRWGERVATGLYLFGILLWGIASLWLDSIYRVENNTLGWGLDCFESFRQTENHVLLSAWIGWGIAMLLCMISFSLLHSAIRGRHFIIVQP
jgi:hypothetical protein